MSASRSAGNGCSITAVRMLLPTRASSSTSSVSRSASLALIRSPNPVWEMNRRNASAVVANPSGTFTPADVRLATISPSEEFLPPTCSRSARPSWENQRTLSVAGPAVVGVAVVIRRSSRGVGRRAGSGWWAGSGGWLGVARLQDHRGHLLHGLGRGVDRRDLVDAVEGLRPTQLEGALLQRGVPGVRAPLVPHLAEPGGGGGDDEAPI